MNKASKAMSVALCVIAVVSVGVNLCLVSRVGRQTEALAALGETQPAYKLYIVIPNEVTNTDAYIHRLEAILANRVTGFTMYPTRGGGSEENGQMKYQTTLVCELYGTDDETVHQIAREAKAEFNLPSVPIASSLSAWEIWQ